MIWTLPTFIDLHTVLSTQGLIGHLFYNDDTSEPFELGYNETFLWEWILC